MGKIVKYCSSCEEGFAERFAFCPDCGSPLQTFEMKPLAADKSTVEQEAPFSPAETEEFNLAPAETDIQEPTIAETVPNVEIRMEEMFSEELPDAEAEVAVEAESFESIEAEDWEILLASDVTEEEVSFASEVEGDDEISRASGASEDGAEAGNADARDPLPAFTGGYFYQTEAVYADEPREREPVSTAGYSHPDDGGFYVTVIQETNTKQRNLLLMGSAAFMLTLTLVATVYSLFNKSLGVSAIDEGALFSAVIVEDVPMTVEEEKQQKDKDQGGGGGGGGRDEKEPTSQGQLASQTQKPLINPTKTIVQKDFELQQPIAATEGNRQMPRTDQPYGDPNSKFGGLSDGTGTGGGQGSGFGQGQGSGMGTGMGSGTGSGSGSGFGDGNGGGSGSGGGPPPEGPKVTTPLRIIDKPRALYNDEGRKNSVQGTVKLRVTLLASGQVGSITPVTRLPYGLTEQAIAAARKIRFEPKRVNGIPITTAVTIEYSFTIY